MSVLVARTTLLQLLDRIKTAENLISTLSCELDSIRQSVLHIKDDTKINKKHARVSSSDSDDVIEEDCCDDAKRPKLDFTKEEGYVVAYTDGACENNGKHNAKAGFGVWFGPNHALNISKPVKGRPTNNNAEIQACIAAVTLARENDITKLKIKTDSQFTISCMTNWIHKWKRNNWQLSTGGPVKNKEELVELDKQCSYIDDIKWEYVAGHKGIRGNEEADKLARAGATLYRSK